MINNLYYKESGKTTPKAIGLMLVAGVIVGLVLGAIYGVAANYIPLVYLVALLAFGLGTAIAYAIDYVSSNISHNRNKYVAIGASVFAGIIAVYAGWVSWIYFFTAKEYLFYNPLDIFYAINVIAEEGAWSIKDFTPTGITLKLIWLGEALLIMGSAAYMSYSFSSSRPYCEHCENWTEEKEVELNANEKSENIITNFENKKFDGLSPIGEEKTNPFFRLKVFTCKDECPQKSHFASVEKVTIAKDNSKKEKTIINHLIITKDEYKSLIEKFKIQ